MVDHEAPKNYTSSFGLVQNATTRRRVSRFCSQRDLTFTWTKMLSRVSCNISCNHGGNLKDFTFLKRRNRNTEPPGIMNVMQTSKAKSNPIF
jgi:hypothetical protein